MNLHGIPEGSILCPLIFNIFSCNFFYFLEVVSVASYANDITPYRANKTNDLVIKETEHFSEGLFQWLDFSFMKINTGKSHILFSGNSNIIALMLLFILLLLFISTIISSYLKIRMNC